MRFVTYENHRNPHVTIHSEGCKQIGKKGGQHKYGQGAYKDHSTFTEAAGYAEKTGLLVISCSFCKPRAAIKNAVLTQEDELRDGNYILHPSPDHNYWANISGGRVAGFVSRRGDAFNIVIVGSPNDEGDFYAIPYGVLKEALKDEFRSTDKTGRVRWIATIKNHQLKVGRYPVPIDVGTFFGCPSFLSTPGQLDFESIAELNEYAIENRKIEIEQRQKQSTFRRRILDNFEGRCCLSGISEIELLVASHIVPWAKRIDTRLDPGNGLLLYCPFDRLFDKGFISFDDNLRVIVSPQVAQCSSPLREILEELAGRQARLPIKWKIKPEYLAYHREVVLQTDSPISGNGYSMRVGEPK